MNKVHEITPNYKASLVGHEMAREKRDDLFAATPPLESHRLIIALCASRQGASDPAENFILMSNVVSRAYFYAPTTRPIYIAIPDEDYEPGDETKVARLNLSLYGTRDAAMNWAKTCSEVMVKCVFVTGQASPCNFYHRERLTSETGLGDGWS